ncbi:MAG: TetR/AcrR family transcriptional regulator [Spirochaetales bacterium]|nr:TetR/AcrR family transcriptional regulator [Spirochaetales bacterium]
MPKIIDHGKRKQEILKQALALFAREGYAQSSLSLLAEKCGISRPTLYLYFKDKDDIFRYALKNFTDGMFHKYKVIASDGERKTSEMLVRIYIDIIDKCGANRDFLVCLSDYLRHEKTQGKNYDDMVRRRTVKLEYMLSHIISQAVRQGEFRELSIRSLVGQFFHMVQAYMFQLILGAGGNREQEIILFKDWVSNLVNPSYS